MFGNLIYRLRARFRWTSMEVEFDEELRAHIEQQTGKCVQAGISAEEAARRARLEFGGINQTRKGSHASQDRRHQKASICASPELRGLKPATDQGCLPRVLRRASANLQKFVGNFHDISAMETLDDAETSSYREATTLDWPPARTTTEMFRYLVLARREGGAFTPIEYRTDLRGREEQPRKTYDGYATRDGGL